MFPRPVSHPTLRLLYCGLGKFFVFSALMLFSLTLCVSQAQAYALQNEQRPPIQQAPSPQSEPGAQLFLPLIAGGVSPLDHDERPSQPSMNVVSAGGHTGDSDTPPPEGNRYTFVTDSGGHLDRSWFRTP